MVSIILITYNHEKYISKAIESILQQKTTFDTELLIGEDCSTDNTREITKEYQKRNPEKIKLITSTKNVGFIQNELRVLKNCKGKYIAFCEGDDYWTDPYKLQKQVDFLEQNPDYGLVHGDVNIYNQETGSLQKAINKTANITIPSGKIFEFLMSPSHAIKTMTVCLRKDILEKYYLSNLEIQQKKWFLIDISIWLTFALHSKIKYMDEVFATYRLLPESMSRSKNPQKLYQFHQKIFNIRFYFLGQKKVSKKTEKKIMLSYNKSLFYDGYNLKDKIIFKQGMQGLQNLNYKWSIKDRIFIFLNLFRK